LSSRETTLCAEEAGTFEDDVLEAGPLEANSFELEAELTAVLEAELGAAEETASAEDGKPVTATGCVPQAGSRRMSVSTKNSNFIFFIQLSFPSSNTTLQLKCIFQLEKARLRRAYFALILSAKPVSCKIQRASRYKNVILRF
jgi:hypothetical protein